MYRATLSFTTKNYDVRKNQILAEDFTTQDEIDEFLNIGYIVVYDDTLEITQNGLYDVEDYQKADVDVPAPQPNLQDKNVTVTQNGETTITADTGYDGLSEVGLNVNVPAPQPSLQDKQVSVTSNTTTTIQADSQYDGLGTVEVTTNVAPDLSEYFNNNITLSGGGVNVSRREGVNIIKKIPDGITFVAPNNNMNYVFQGCQGLIEIGHIIITTITNMRSTFNDCENLETIALFDTSNVQNMQETFFKCFKLANIPIFNLSSATNLTNIFGLCSALSNTSLNNILASLITAISYTGTKTLAEIGLSSTQIETCQTLSNWNDFVNAGWSA